MLLAAALGFVWLSAGGDYHDTPEWKAYQKRVTGAYAIEVHWTEKEYQPRRLSDKTLPNAVRSYHARCMKPNYLWFEEEGVRRVVWNGKEGLVLDLKGKTFTKLEKLPDLRELYWLDLPSCPDPQRTTGQYNDAGSSTKRVGNELLPEVSSTIHEIDYARIWTFYFDSKSRLIRLWRFISYGMGPNTEVLRSVSQFDMTPLLIRSDFDLAEPSGFSEKATAVTADTKTAK